MKSISSLFVVFLLSACGGVREDNISSSETNSDEFKLFELSLEGPRANFLDMVEGVEILSLEETDNSLIGHVSGFTEFENEYFIHNYTRAASNFLRYTKSGEFIAVFDRSGEGPEEYSSANGAWEQDGQLSIHMKYEKKIQQYHLNGDHIKTIEIPFVADQVLPFRGGYALDMNHAMLEDSLKYDVFVYDNDFKLVDQWIPYTNVYDGFRMSSDNNGFFPYKNGHTYIRTMSDSLFFIKEDGAHPLAKFDFGKNWIWNTGAKKPSFMPREGEPVTVSIISVYSDPNWFYISPAGNQMGGEYILIDRKSGEYNWMDFKIPEGVEYRLTPLQSKNGRLLMSVSSEYLGDFLRQLKADQYAFVEGNSLEKAESSENPVLMWVKFKKGFQ